MKRSLALPALLLCVVLSGCAAADPEAELRGRTQDVLDAANREDTAALRDSAQDLLSTISKLGGSGKLTPSREEELRKLTLAILEDAGLLDVAEVPSPAPTSAAPKISPKASPSPSPSPLPPPPPPSPSPSPPPPPPPPSPSPTESKGPKIKLPVNPSSEPPASPAGVASASPSPTSRPA